jgi:hypothetical protein
MATSHLKGMEGRPVLCSKRTKPPEREITYGPCAYGDGVPIVLCVRESRTHGEGEQGVFIPNDA